MLGRFGNILGADALAHFLAVSEGDDEGADTAVLTVDHQTSNDDGDTGHITLRRSRGHPPINIQYQEIW